MPYSKVPRVSCKHDHPSGFSSILLFKFKSLRGWVDVYGEHRYKCMSMAIPRHHTVHSMSLHTLQLLSRFGTADNMLQGYFVFLMYFRLKRTNTILDFVLTERKAIAT